MNVVKIAQSLIRKLSKQEGSEVTTVSDDDRLLMIDCRRMRCLEWVDERFFLASFPENQLGGGGGGVEIVIILINLGTSISTGSRFRRADCLFDNKLHCDMIKAIN